MSECKWQLVPHRDGGWVLCCLTSTEARRPIRDGDDWEKGGQKSETSKQAPTRKTEAAVDHRQNNRMLRQCSSGIAATTAPRSCCPNCYAEQSHRDNVRSSAVGKQLKQKKPNSQAQIHLSALDLVWANFRESPTHLPPLDLTWTLHGTVESRLYGQL